MVGGEERGFDEVGVDGGGEEGEVEGGAGFEDEREDVWVEGDG